MKKLIALFLCLLLPFAAIAEETDLTALWEQLAAYKADLESQSAALDPEISSWDTYGASGGANVIRISGNLDVSTLYVASGKSDGLCRSPRGDRQDRG